MALATEDRIDDDPHTNTTVRMWAGYLPPRPSAAAELPPGSVAVVLGTRPEIIKLAGVIRELGPAARVIHTGQHYDEEMSGTFFRQLGLPHPHTLLSVGGASRAQQIAAVIGALDDEWSRERPIAVIVQGDTNATVAGAMAANALEIPLVHVEAGLRSHDRNMPEEHNRVVTDHLADVCCAATPFNVTNLAAEGIDADRVVLTGNTVVEAVHAQLPDADTRAALLRRHDLPRDGFVLATIHRPENTDDPDRLLAILTELSTLDIPVLLPIHPRTRARVEEFGLTPLLDKLTTCAPMSGAEFLGLAAECAVLISDSGGVQEECSVVKRPLIVVRNSTERPEVMGSFARLVQPGPAIGAIARDWLTDIATVHAQLADVPSPYGDGQASTRVVTAVADLYADSWMEREVAS